MTQDTIEQIIAKIGKIKSQKSNSSLSKERQWILAQLKNPDLATVVSGLSIVALHLLSELQSGEKTGIQLAKELDVTRGGVTRAAKTLLESNLINANKHPDDQKKIFYELTPQGQEVAAVHTQLHQKMKQELGEKIASKYTTEDLNLVAKFLDDVMHIDC